MPTRSGKEYKMNNVTIPIDKKCLYDVMIDFDEASKSWRKNKISLGNGIFKYKK